MKKLLTFALLLTLYTSVFGQCSGLEISSNKTTVCAPELVNFQLLNTPDSVSIEWNLGSGWTNGSETAVGYFDTPGSIDISVRLTHANGSVCTMTESSMISVREKPNPIISANSFTLCDGPAELTFTDNTPYSATRNWIIDGTNYNNATSPITHKFTSIGSKNISLIVIDSFGCQGVTQLQDTIKIYDKPSFDFISDIKKGCTPQTVELEVSEPVDQVFDPIYTWYLDGTTKDSAKGMKTGALSFNTSGSFDVTLKVELNNGCSYDLSRSNYLRFGETSSLSQSLTDTSICKGTALPLVLNSSNPNGKWNCDLSGIAFDSIHKSKDEITLYPLSSGQLIIDLKHTDNGCVSSASFSVNIEVMEIDAKFSSEDNFHCAVPHTVHLSNTTDPKDASSFTQTWNIYDKGTLIHSSTNLDDSMTFTTLPGYYDVELVVVGDNGCTDTLRKKNFICQDTMDVSFIAIPSIGCIGQEILYKNTSKASTYIEDDQYEWTFFDLDGSVLDTSSEKDAYMSYYNTGIYSTQLIGYNSLGCTDTIELDAVEIIDPVLAFTVSDSIVCKGDKFKATALTTPDVEEMSHEWIFTELSTGKTKKYNGKEVDIKALNAGNHLLTYSFNIKGGCYNADSMIIHVNGVDGEITMPAMQACAPFSLEASLELDHNLHFGSNDADISYDWTVKPTNNVVYGETNSAQPEITLFERGNYSVEVTMENSMGCSQKVNLEGIQVGVDARLAIPDKSICLGDTLFVKNKSKNIEEVEFNYHIANYSSMQHIPLGNRDAIIVSDSGKFQLDLIASMDGVCSDTSSMNFRVIQVVADFASNDTFLKCAPVYVQFNSLSINQDSLYWNFGDGNTFATTELSAGTIYENNTGEEEGYDVQLIATNKEGCVDTMFKQDFVRVSGPRPEFTLEDHIGCETANVKFINKTEGANYLYIDYMDGSALDSTMGTHVYQKLTDDSVEYFYPTIYVGDDNGCVAQFKSSEPVTLYAAPKTSFNTPDLSGVCAPAELEFINTTSDIINSAWYVNSDMITTSTDLSMKFNTYGDHEISLITENKYGCFDTAVSMIALQGVPEISISMEDSICLYNTLNFDALIKHDAFLDTNGIQIHWNFDEEDNPNNEMYGLTDPQFAYFTPGNKKVKLTVSLANGCADSSTLELDLRGSEELDQPQFNYLTFVAGYDLKLNHEKTTDDHFAAYQYTRSDGQVYSNTVQAKTNFMDQFYTVPDSALCYDIHIIDHCGLEGLKARKHCFIFLAITSNESFKNELEWTKYVGWDKVENYKVYRRIQGESTFEMIAVLNGETTRYVDGGLCDNSYEYYVQAVNDKEETSNSFKVINRPEISDNEFKSSIANASVIGEDQIELHWNQSAFEHFDHFVLSKYNGSSNQFIEEFELTDTTYVDLNVSTDEASYIYYVREVDICGSINEAERMGKTILLEAGYDNVKHKSSLTWSSYKEWENGVEKYLIQLETVNGMEIVGSTSADDTSFIDEEYHETLNGKYCYTIIAVGVDGDTSYSNTDCVNGDPISYIPNAFSPNNDGLNDNFRPVCRFVDHQAQINGFSMEIYNRWGEMIYQSNDLINGWDGSYKGKECQQGAYIYKLHYKGVDGINYYHKGTVTLVK